jgi:hypothetical protein
MDGRANIGVSGEEYRCITPPLGVLFSRCSLIPVSPLPRRKGERNEYKRKTTGEDMKVRLSTLWVFVMFNMVFADIVGFLNPGTLENMMAMEPPPGLLLVFSILLEIPIAMIVLSRILRYRANRWANIIAGVITILFVSGFGNTSLSYIFFATIEIACMLLIIWYAWKWTEHEGQPGPVDRKVSPS